MAFVYIHQFPNGKRYIGITIQENPEKRWANGRGYFNNVKMQRAIKKYGWKNVQHTIFAKDVTEEEAENIEKHLIEKYRTMDSRFGYNMTSGGEKAKRYSEASRRKMSSIVKKGYETGDRIPPEMKSVDVYTKSGKLVCTYKSLAEAARCMNLVRSNMARACNGKYKTCGGYVLRYHGIPFDEYSHECGSAAKTVDMYTLDGEIVRTFDSAVMVQNETGISSRSVASVCNGKRISTHGYVFRYHGEQFEKHRVEKEYSSKVVVQKTLSGEEVSEFPSATVAARIMGCSVGAITLCARGLRNQAKGFRWEYK